MNIRILTPLLLILFSAAAQGQTFIRTLSDDKPGINNDIEVAYTFTYTGGVGSMKHDDFTDFTVKSGPFQSNNQNMTLVNGKYVTTNSLVLRYVLVAKHTGAIVLHGASITDKEGKTYTTTDTTIQVSAEAKILPIKHKETADAMYQLGKKIKDSRYKYLIATGPVYMNPDITAADSILHRTLQPDLQSIMSVYTKCEALDTVYWENFPLQILQQMDSSMRQHFSEYIHLEDMPRYYFSVADTGFLYTVLQSLHSADKNYRYLTEIMPANNWKADREENTIRGAYDMYAAVRGLIARYKASGMDIKEQKHLGIIFSFDNEEDATAFTVPVLASGYTPSKPVKATATGQPQTGYTVTVSSNATPTPDGLEHMAEELQHMATDHHGCYRNLSL